MREPYTCSICAQCVCFSGVMFHLWHSCTIPALFRISFPLPDSRSFGLAGFIKMCLNPATRQDLSRKHNNRPRKLLNIPRARKMDYFTDKTDKSCWMWFTCDICPCMKCVLDIWHLCAVKCTVLKWAQWSSCVLHGDSDQCSRFCCV